jgi:hypothetical protein
VPALDGCPRHPQSQSAKLVGEAVQQNPSFITLRKIEAAREIAGTVAASANRVFLPADSLLLNLVSAGRIELWWIGGMTIVPVVCCVQSLNVHI